MHINWRAILAGLVGGLVAALVGGYVLTTGLDAPPDAYTTSGMLWAGVGTLVGGVAATAVGWVLNGRRDAGLGGIAALTAVLGAFGSTFAWASVIAPLAGLWQLLVGTVLMLGLTLIGLVAACGTTAAVLKPASVLRAHEPVR